MYRKTALLQGCFFVFFTLKKMKLFKSNCTKIILILNAVFIIGLSGCDKKYSEITIQQELVSDIEKLNREVVDFETIAEESHD